MANFYILFRPKLETKNSSKSGQIDGPAEKAHGIQSLVVVEAFGVINSKR